MNAEDLCLKQGGICATKGCGVNMPVQEESYGMKCHQCEKLYCKKCYSEVHHQHNMAFWD